MSSDEERAYIADELMPEIQRDFDLWAKEYQLERDLGKLGEFVGLYRKVRKLRTLLWDNNGPNPPRNDWRESERVIIKEVVAHGLLMLVDFDREDGAFQRFIDKLAREEDD